MHTKPHTHTNALSRTYTLNALSCTQTHVHSHTNTLTHTHSHTHELSHTVMHTDTHMCTHNLSLSGPAYSPHSSFLVSSPKDTCPPTCPVPKCPASAHKGIHYVPTLVLSLPVIGAPYVTHTPLYTRAILMKPAGRPTLRNIIQHFISPLCVSGAAITGQAHGIFWLLPWSRLHPSSLPPFNLHSFPALPVLGCLSCPLSEQEPQMAPPLSREKPTPLFLASLKKIFPVNSSL